MTQRELVERAMDDYVVGDAWPPGVEEVPVPPDVASASAILRRLKYLDRELAQLDEVVDAEVRRLEAFRADSTAGVRAEIRRGEAALVPFMRSWSAAAHKKTLALADGKLTLRDPGAGRIVVEDEAAVVAWAQNHGAVSADPGDVRAVNLKPTVSRTALGQSYANSQEPIAVEVDDDGAEVCVYALVGPDDRPIPGVTRVVARDDKFDVTIGED